MARFPLPAVKLRSREVPVDWVYVRLSQRRDLLEGGFRPFPCGAALPQCLVPLTPALGPSVSNDVVMNTRTARSVKSRTGCHRSPPAPTTPAATVAVRFQRIRALKARTVRPSTRCEHLTRTQPRGNSCLTGTNAPHLTVDSLRSEPQVEREASVGRWGHWNAPT